MSKQLERFGEWLNVASAGDQHVYWATKNQNDFALRRAHDGKPTARQREFADCLAFAAEMADLGRVALFQRKNAEWQHDWVAARLSNSPPKILLKNLEVAQKAKRRTSH